jgi:adenosylhomocysteinase
MFNLIKLNLICCFYILIINRNFAFRYQLNLKTIHYI